MRRDFLKTAALAGAGLAGSTAAFAQTAASTGLRGNPNDVYVMNVMVSGVEYWFPVYEMMKQLGQSLGVKTRYTGTPEYDVNKQVASFEQELARKPAGICKWPLALVFIWPVLAISPVAWRSADAKSMSRAT